MDDLASAAVAIKKHHAAMMPRKRIEELKQSQFAPRIMQQTNP